MYHSGSLVSVRDKISLHDDSADFFGFINSESAIYCNLSGSHSCYEHYIMLLLLFLKDEDESLEH
jgi:hypothetical protein